MQYENSNFVLEEQKLLTIWLLFFLERVKQLTANLGRLKKKKKMKKEIKISEILFISPLSRTSSIG